MRLNLTLLEELSIVIIYTNEGTEMKFIIVTGSAPPTSMAIPDQQPRSQLRHREDLLIDFLAAPASHPCVGSFVEVAFCGSAKTCLPSS